MAARMIRWTVALLVLAGSTACGPTQATSWLMDADTMLAAARTAQAEKLAPYEWTAANLYLDKSKEEVGYSDWEQAVDYAKKAVEYATRARDNSLKAARQRGPALTPPLVPVP